MSRLKEAIILAIGLMVMGWSIKCGIDNYAHKDRKVTVKGAAEREVPADKVTWSLCTTQTGNDLPSLYQQVSQLTLKIKDFMVQYGLDEQEITINPPTVEDLETYLWSDNKKSYRYLVRTNITVCTNRVEQVNTAISHQGELLEQGVAISSETPYYEYAAFQDLKPAMMADAIKAAQQTAQQFAEASNAKLGSIVTAGQGQFEITDRDQNTPYIKKLRVVATVTYALN